jgi:hypothetical protein
LQIVADGNDALGSTGRLVVPCVIQNGTTELNVESNVGAEIRWDRELELKARAPGARQIVFRHSGQEIAKLSSAEGTVKIDPRRLGEGPIYLQPVAALEGGREIYGAPLRFRVIAPPMLPASTAPEGKKLAKGFHLRAGAAPIVVIEKTEAEWLTKAGVKPDADFTIEGWFTVEKDDVYQFQMRGPASLTLTVDDVAQTWPRGKEWWFVPVALAKGMHHMKIEGKAGSTPKLEARFGGPGSYRLSGERFQHLE